ncbi:MAG: DUF2179 domain-containing protein [Anaerolineae bacterium]
MDPYMSVSLIFVLRVLHSLMATVRTIWMLRGKKFLSALFAFMETTIFIFTASMVILKLDIWNILSYSGGFAVGLLIGMFVDEKIALGFALVRIISMKEGANIAERLRERGFGVTEVSGKGREGGVYIVESVIPRGEVPNALSCINALDNKAFVTIEEVKSVTHGFVPGGGFMHRIMR